MRSAGAQIPMKRPLNGTTHVYRGAPKPQDNGYSRLSDTQTNEMNRCAEIGF